MKRLPWLLVPALLVTACTGADPTPTPSSTPPAATTSSQPPTEPSPDVTLMVGRLIPDVGAGEGLEDLRGLITVIDGCVVLQGEQTTPLIFPLDTVFEAPETIRAPAATVRLNTDIETYSVPILGGTEPIHGFFREFDRVPEAALDQGYASCASGPWERVAVALNLTPTD